MPGVVLVVDDNRVSRELIHRRLVREGYEVVVVESGAAALEAVQLHPVELVLLDLHMPDMSGSTVTEQLRQEFPPLELPILMVSASDDTPSMIHCIEAGATDYLTKPVQFDLLFAKIRQHLKLRPRPVILQPEQDLVGEPLPHLGPGDRLAHYRLEESLGQGGMGEVYRAQDTRLLRQVAIKLIHHEPKPGVALDRFLTEARALARVDHPGVVKVYEIGLKPCRFLAMEFVSGKPLLDYLRDQPIGLKVEAFVQLLEALEAVHLQGTVHRDLKPGNVLVNEDGKVKLMDFGLAKTAELDPLQGDSLYGTPLYMAPECFNPGLGRVDAQSDLFAATVMLYESLTGQHPFYSESLAELIDQISHKTPPSPHIYHPEIPLELCDLIFLGLEKEKNRRLATARQFYKALKAFAGQA